MCRSKRIDPEAALNATITLANGVVRDCRAEPADARYVGFFVEYELLADERVSGMVEIWVNMTMRSAPRFADLTEMLANSESPALDRPAESTPASNVVDAIADAWTLGARLATRAIDLRLQDTLDSLRRRRQRDFIRLHDYYSAIDGEVRHRVRRAAAKQDDRLVKAELSRLEATASTYRGRITELVDRYRARVRLRPIAALISTLTVHRVTARFHRRSASRVVSVAWNPIDRGIEPPCCEACGNAAPTVVLCDDRVHMLCTGCHTACVTCGRTYCRACHTRCPKRHEADTSLVASPSSPT